jgi:hypothetical protein
MAERARFELAEDRALSSFRDYRLQPLGHLSLSLLCKQGDLR